MNEKYTFFANFEDLFVHLMQNCEFRAINSAPATMYKELDRMDTKQRLRMKSVLYVTDLSQKLNDPSRTKSVSQKSQLYLGLLFIISIFYSLPVLQMVFRFFVTQLPPMLYFIIITHTISL